jgi:hypothetical protein
MQMKKILGILLAVCFLMSVTAAAVSAEPGNIGGEKKFGDKSEKKFGDRDDKKIEKKVIKTLKVVKTRDGLRILQLVKYTMKDHDHKKVWFATEWIFVSFHEQEHGQEHGQIHR